MEADSEIDLDTLGMKDQVPTDSGILVAMIVVYRLFTFVNLWFFKGNTNL